MADAAHRCSVLEGLVACRGGKHVARALPRLPRVLQLRQPLRPLLRFRTCGCSCSCVATAVAVAAIAVAVAASAAAAAAIALYASLQRGEECALPAFVAVGPADAVVLIFLLVVVLPLAVARCCCLGGNKAATVVMVVAITILTHHHTS